MNDEGINSNGSATSGSSRSSSQKPPRVARPAERTEGSARAAAILLFMLSFLLAPFGLTFLLAIFPDGAPWWVPVGIMLLLAAVIGHRRRPAGMGVATGTLVWIGVLVWITNFVN